MATTNANLIQLYLYMGRRKDAEELMAWSLQQLETTAGHDEEAIDKEEAERLDQQIFRDWDIAGISKSEN